METFILFLSGLKKEIIDDCKVDKHHALIIGAILFVVGIYAIGAWTCFFQTLLHNWLISIFPGLLFGSFIVCFDRSLIASMAATNKDSKRAIGFRFFLAILLGIWLSNPMILFCFKSDIDREAGNLIEKDNKKYQQNLDSTYFSIFEPLYKEKNELNSRLQTKDSIYNVSVDNFNKEMDGSGGTGRWGYNQVAQQKEIVKNDYKKEYNDLKSELSPRMKTIDAKIDSISQQKNNDYDAYSQKYTTDGYIMQNRALWTLISENPFTLGFRYLLLSIILTLVELSALIAKLLFKMKSYQSKVDSITEIEIKYNESNKNVSLHSSTEFENKLKQSLSGLIRKFFDKTNPTGEIKVEEINENWKVHTEITYSDLCQSFMDKLLIQGIGLNSDTGGVKMPSKINKEINDFLANIYVFMFVVILLSIIFLYIVAPYAGGSTLTIISIIVGLIDISTFFYKNAIDNTKDTKTKKLSNENSN